MKKLWMLVMVFFIIGCGGNADETAEDATPTTIESTAVDDTSGTVVAENFPPDSPEAAIQVFLSACLIGDSATTLDSFLPDLRALIVATDSPICESMRDMTDVGSHYSTEMAGQTARVEWQWAWEGGEQRYFYELSRAEGEWFLLDGDFIDISDEVNMPAEILVSYEDDASLLEGVSYISQMGTAGGQETIVTTGTMPRNQVMAEAKQFVEAYFADYQTGDFQAVTSTVYPDDIEQVDVEAVNTIANMEITEIDIDEPTEISVYATNYINESYRLEPLREFALQNEPYLEPPIVEVVVPVFIRFRALGHDWTDETDMAVIYHPEQGWMVRYWGILTAVAEAESQVRDTYEFRLDGLALTHQATLVVATVVQPDLGDLNWVSISVSDDLTPTPTGSAMLDMAEGVTTGAVQLDPFDARAVTAVVTFRMSPKGIFDYYDGEVSVALP